AIAVVPIPVIAPRWGLMVRGPCRPPGRCPGLPHAAPKGLSTPGGGHDRWGTRPASWQPAGARPRRGKTNSPLDGPRGVEEDGASCGSVPPERGPSCPCLHKETSMSENAKPFCPECEEHVEQPDVLDRRGFIRVVGERTAALLAVGGVAAA